MDCFSAMVPNSLKLVFTKKCGEKTQLVPSNASNRYSLTRESWSPQLPNADIEPPTTSHCHHNSKTDEQRQIEQKQAQRRLTIALVICTLFMIGEVVEPLPKYSSIQPWHQATPPSAGIDLPTTAHCSDNGKAQEQRQIERKQAQRRLAIALVICILFMFGEVVGGYLAGSLAVLSDAAHLLADVTSFLISLCSLWLSSRPATKKLNFGWYRAEILGALFSVIIVWLVTGILVYLASERLIHADFEINGLVMVITSSCAVAANLIMGLVLHQHGHGHSHGATHLQGSKEVNHGHQPNASLRAAFIHVVGDFLQSVSVLISAIVILFKPECKIMDPICTFIFSVLVLGTTINILRDILLVLMEGAPIGLNYNAVKEKILAVNGVKTMHSLHLWALSMNQVVLSVHVAIVDTVDPQQVLKEITLMVHSTFNVHSATIQVEQHLDQEPNCAYCQEPKD